MFSDSAQSASTTTIKLWSIEPAYLEQWETCFSAGYEFYLLGLVDWLIDICSVNSLENDDKRNRTAFRLLEQAQAVSRFVGNDCFRQSGSAYVPIPNPRILSCKRKHTNVQTTNMETWKKKELFSYGWHNYLTIGYSASFITCICATRWQRCCIRQIEALPYDSLVEPSGASYSGWWRLACSVLRWRTPCMQPVECQMTPASDWRWFALAAVFI